ncbi:MAG TPA: EAL domain-containing protein [Noviherbaspirillum sp.]|nr:EAL domain-containing protein [Noviherbaspirillum sp.]
MSTIVTYSSTHVLSSEFFMARRPVLDSRQHLAAHELLFCQAESGAGAASIIADVVQHGIARVIGDMPAYLPVDGAVLAGDLMQAIPPQHVVLVLPEATPVTPQLLSRIEELRQGGFAFALDVANDGEHVRQLLPLAAAARIDLATATPERLAELAGLCKAHGKKLLARGVDTLAQFEVCAALGFDYFQGYYFTKRQVGDGKKLTPTQQAVSDLIALIDSDAADADIERSIKTNVALGLNLLRLANTPATSAHRIDSLRQALAVVGRNQLRRWLQIMQHEEISIDTPRMMPLLTLATARGRLLELVAHKLVPGNRGIGDTAFMVGIMSLMDTVFGVPMHDILHQIPLVDEVRDALLSRQGYFGALLTLAEHIERIDRDCARLQQQMRELRLSHNDLYLLQLAAFEWSDQASRNLR